MLDSNTRALLADCLRDRQCGFSVGGFGALAEFHDETGEFELHSDGAMTVSSPRGAVRVVPGTAEVLAYELLSGNPDSWQCGILLNGPEAAHRMGSRTVLTELGADTEAIEPDFADGILFDLGAGLSQVDFCIRTTDSILLGLLRKHLGQVVITEAHPVMEAIIDASPHRVSRSSLARIEVYQTIDRHQTPVGPHTHLLPDLLRHRRTHSANIPVPEGHVPLLTVHPSHPLYDATGTRHAFDADAHERFQPWLDSYGDQRFVTAKRNFEQAVRTGLEPDQFKGADTRAGRLGERIALRQLTHTLDPARTQPWLERFGS